MFSRRVDSAAGSARWRSLFGGESIAGHIARIHTLSALVLLAIVVGLLYWVESQSLQRDRAFFLSDKLLQLRMAMQQETDKFSLLAHEVEVESGIYARSQHYVFHSRVLDEARQVLIETPGMKKILPVGLFPPPVGEKEIPREAQRAMGTDGRSYRLMTGWGEKSGANPARRMIQVALDDTAAVDFITQYQCASLLLVLLGILFSARIGVLAARSGLRPLADITRVAQQITASQLHRRLQPERWPRELTALAQAFDGMLGRLDDSHIRLAQFSGDLAHDLRTPIHALTGQIEFALSKEHAPREYRRILEPALEQLQTLTRMIDELLFLARAEDPKTQIRRRWVDARQELEAVREFHEDLAEENGISLTCRGEAQLYADTLLVRRALTNLLSNALRHTPRGGCIVLSVERVGDQDIVLKVSDTGCGIVGENLHSLCERRFCSGRGAARCAGGNGLGLPIVRSIAELHGGKTEIESTPGHGTTVALHFPAPALAAA